MLRDARRCAARIGVVFVALLAVQYARAARPVLRPRRVRRHHPAARAARRDDRRRRPADRRVARRRSDTHVLALPLAYIYARNVLVLARARPDKAAFAAFLDWARTRYARVLFMGGGGTDLLSHRWGVAPLAERTLPGARVRVAASNAYPRSRAAEGVRLRPLRVLTPPDAAVPAGSTSTSASATTCTCCASTPRKQTEGRTFRWSQRHVVRVGDDASAQASREVTLWMSDGGRPAAAPPADVTRVARTTELLGTVARAPIGFHAVHAADSAGRRGAAAAVRRAGRS